MKPGSAGAPASTDGALLTHSELDGVSIATDWHQWIGAGRAPAYEGPRGDWLDGGWVEDLQLLHQLGFDSLGLTIEWAVLEPNQGNHDEKAIENFRSLLDGAAELGLAVSAYLIDGSLPGWFAVDERGFSDDRSRSLLWPNHVEWVGETFGDRVSSWVPIRESAHHAVRSNLLAMAPPGRADPNDATKAVKAMLLAEGEAWRVLRGSAPVATHQTARLFLPSTENVKAERHAHELTELHRGWISTLVDGAIRLPDLPETQTGILRDAFDSVVLQLRPAVRIDGEGGWEPTDLGFVTEGLATALHDHVDALGSRSLEVSLDLAPIVDDGSAQLDHLATLRDEATALGVSRWWQSSPIDGWHWQQGHSQPGIVSADREARAVADLFAR